MLLSLHKKWSFPLKISSVNVTKSAGNCGFGHIYNLHCKQFTSLTFTFTICSVQGWYTNPVYCKHQYNKREPSEHKSNGKFFENYYLETNHHTMRHSLVLNFSKGSWKEEANNVILASEF